MALRTFETSISVAFNSFVTPTISPPSVILPVPSGVIVIPPFVSVAERTLPSNLKLSTFSCPVVVCVPVWSKERREVRFCARAVLYILSGVNSARSPLAHPWTPALTQTRARRRSASSAVGSELKVAGSLGRRL